jgi:UDP-glucose 4-epimerase
MNFLITGAAGFLGSSLANHLAREGHQVRGLDDLSTGNPQALVPDVHFTRGDVSDRPKLWTLLQEVDVVYHLAARVSVPESVLYPRDYNNVNVGGTVALMEAMRDVGVRRVVLASSGAVYGDLGVQTLTESIHVRPMPYPNSPRNTTSARLADCGALKLSACESSTRMDRVNIYPHHIHPWCRIT